MATFAENVNIITGQLNITGSSDKNQILVTANGTQTNKVVQINNSSAANLLSLDNSGNQIIAGGLTAVAINTSASGSAIFGLTSGSAVSAGYVGESNRTALTGSTVTTSTGGTSVNVMSFSLAAGVWQVYGTFCCALTTGSSLAVGNACVGNITLSTGSAGGTTLESAAAEVTQTVSSETTQLVSQLSFSHVISVSSTTTYYVNTICNQSTATGEVQVFVNNVNLSGGVTGGSYVLAVRIA